MKAASRPTTAPEPTPYRTGTGYFGSRTPEEEFSLERFKDLIDEVPEIRMIEIKLSQGAKLAKEASCPAPKSPQRSP